MCFLFCGCFRRTCTVGEWGLLRGDAGSSGRFSRWGHPVLRIECFRFWTARWQKVP